MYELPDAHIEL